MQEPVKRVVYCLLYEIKRRPHTMTDFSKWIVFLLTFNVLLFPKDISTLKLLKIDVPKLVLKGEITILRCEYELEGDRLYSVLWYKDHEEFYKFIPRNEPKQNSYKLDGFRVEIHNSNDQQVLLRNVNLKASGNYRCEVSAEAPSFTSVHGEGRMEVIAPPKEDPEITGGRKIYQIGDTISLNCTSGKSYPSTRLRWFVNDLQTNSDFEAVFQHHGLLTTTIGLNLKIQARHFRKGRMVVRCVSTMSHNKNIFFENILPAVDRRETLFLVEGKGNIVRIPKWIIVITILNFLT